MVWNWGTCCSYTDLPLYCWHCICNTYMASKNSWLSSPCRSSVLSCRCAVAWPAARHKASGWSPSHAHYPVAVCACQDSLTPLSLPLLFPFAPPVMKPHTLLLLFPNQSPVQPPRCRHLSHTDCLPSFRPATANYLPSPSPASMRLLCCSQPRSTCCLRTTPTKS